MALKAASTAGSNGSTGGPEPPGPRPVSSHSVLPRGRAVLGGLLIAVAMVASIVLSRSGEGPPTVPVVVAAGPISPGDALGPDNLAVEHLPMPDELVGATYADPDSLLGTVARSFLAPGEALQRGAVVESTAAQRSAAPAREVSLRIDMDRAVDGRLEPGDRIDLLATYGTGVDALTFVVLTDTPVLAVARGDGGIGRSTSLVLTLALEQRSETLALAHAVDNADITVVRTTTTGPPERNDTAPFRPTRAQNGPIAIGDGE